MTGLRSWRRGCLDDDDDIAQAKKKTKVMDLLQDAVDTLNEFHAEVAKYWGTERQRILGHIAYSPPISVGTGTKRYRGLGSHRARPREDRLEDFQGQYH